MAIGKVFPTRRNPYFHCHFFSSLFLVLFSVVSMHGRGDSPKQDPWHAWLNIPWGDYIGRTSGKAGELYKVIYTGRKIFR